MKSITFWLSGGFLKACLALMSMLCSKALGVYKYHTGHFPLTSHIGWIRPETHSGDIHVCRKKATKSSCHDSLREFCFAVQLS